LQQHVFTIAEVCAQYGITDAIICPGSRSAPLVYAFTNNNSFTCHSAIDERSAAFIALGIAQQQQRPVVLICTSGTATLNFFPAVAEAYYQKIPLLVLSADRPPELLNQQDGQMIMQKGVFGKHVLGSHELLCFEEDNIDFQLTERIVSNALDACLSEKGYGPVHINVPLREPLYNYDFQKLDLKVPKTPISFQKRGAIQLPNFEGFMAAWKHSKKKLIVIGQWPISSALNEALSALCTNNELVILADLCANQHLTKSIENFDFVLKTANVEVLDQLKPDLLLSFGGPLISKSLKNWLKSFNPTWHFRLQASEDAIDTWGNMTHLLCAPEIPYLSAIAKQKQSAIEEKNQYFNLWKSQIDKAGSTLSQFHEQQVWCEPTSIHQILAAIPQDCMVQVGNSSAIRWTSWNFFLRNDLEVFCNRGTSGIDGSFSTAVGAAIAKPHKLVYLIIGDISFNYDEHALWIEKLPENLKIIVLNNNGGNIFNWIDGPGKHPQKLSFFTTPIVRSIAQICASYQVEHRLAESSEQLQNHLVQTEKNNKLTVIELKFENLTNSNAIHSFLSLKPV
jgi:2-succinyl-5-enolpyruvyl-6-hydroxy-3-cyclohexene-1-carboxylate synthase